MLNLRFTAGVGVGISGACEPPLVWRTRKPLPWALRSSAALALCTLSASRCRAPPPLSSSSSTESLTAPPTDAAFSSLFCFFSIFLFFLHLLVALRLWSLRFHSPRSCRVIAVFLIQTNVSVIKR